MLILRQQCFFNLFNYLNKIVEKKNTCSKAITKFVENCQERCPGRSNVEFKWAKQKGGPNVIQDTFLRTRENGTIYYKHAFGLFVLVWEIVERLVSKSGRFFFISVFLTTRAIVSFRLWVSRRCHVSGKNERRSRKSRNFSSRSIAWWIEILCQTSMDRTKQSPVIVGNVILRRSLGTYKASFRFDERPILSVHFVVESAGVAEVMPGAVPSPEGCRCRATVDALATLCQSQKHRY